MFFQAGEAVKVQRGSISQPQAREAIGVRAGFLTAQHFSRGWASPVTPFPLIHHKKQPGFPKSSACPRAPQSHHHCPGGKWRAENLLPGHKRLLLVLTPRPSLDLGESLHTHINIHSYTAPPHATRHVLLVTFRSLLTFQLGPDCGWWILRNLALSYFGLALQSTETDTPQLSCAFSAAQERADLNWSRGASSMEEKRKGLPTLMHCSSFGLSFPECSL